MSIPALVEGYLESVFLPVLLIQIGRGDLDPIIRNAGGGRQFWDQARRYNAAGRNKSLLGLADLEQARCAPHLLSVELPQKSAGFHLRLAVRMLESWLIADRARLASFLRVPTAAVPNSPDELPHPKRTLIDIARRSARRTIREGMVPEDSGALVGPEYVPMMSQFIQLDWRAAAARDASPSLDRTCVRWMAV